MRKKIHLEAPGLFKGIFALRAHCGRDARGPSKGGLIFAKGNYDQHSQDKRDQRRQQAKLAEVFDDEGL